MRPIPSVQAMLICERIIDEVGTRNKSLINIFTRIQATGVPIQMRVAVYARLTDAEGDYAFRVDLVRLSDDQKMAQMNTASQHIDNRLAVAELALQTPIPFVFDQFGKYEFQLFGNDIFLAHVSADIVSLGGEANVR